MLAAVAAGADDAGADDEDELAVAEEDAVAEVVGVGDVAVAVGDVVGVGDALVGCDVAAYVGVLDEE